MAELGVPARMPTEPNQPASDDADPEKQSTPAGMTEELEERAEDIGATTESPSDS